MDIMLSEICHMQKTLLIFTMKPKSCDFLGFSEARGSHVARSGQRVSRNQLRDLRGKDVVKKEKPK